MKSRETEINKMLYQVGTINSLLAGVYEGDVSFKDLANYGDFGLGTFDAVNGEMIAVEGNYYQIDAYGNAHPVAPEMKSPFAVVAHYREEFRYDIGACADIVVLQHLFTTNSSPTI